VAAGALLQPMLAGFKPTTTRKQRETCPDCGSPTLDRLKRGRFNLRRCGNCAGLWLDAATVKRLRSEITPRWRGFLVNALGSGLGGIFGGE